MARYEYGQSADSTVAEPVGDNLTLADGVVVSFWSAVTGGTQYTSLVAIDGVTTVGPTFTIDVTGILPRFMGPDGVAFMWLDAGFTGGVRVRVPGQWVPGSVVAATETVSGISRRATQAETNAGTLDTPFVTPLKLALTTLFRRSRNDSISLQGATETAGDYTIIDDGTTQTSWPIRWSMFFGAIRTGHFDKYGQTRANAAKATTTAFRVENRNATPTANLIEAGVGATDVLFGVSSAGLVTAPNIGAKVLVLNVDDPVPASTPDRTLIIRLTAADTGGGGSVSALIADHLHEGTVGTTPTASQEGYTGTTGAAPVYVTGGTVGSAALRWSGTASGHFDDTFTARSTDLFVRFYFKPVSYTGAIIPVTATGTVNLTSIRYRAADIVLWDNVAGSTAGSTAGTKPALGSWSRFEWTISLTGATLNIWTTNPASTGAPDQALTMTFTTALTERPTSVGFGQWSTSNSPVDIDAVAIGTSLIGPAA